MTARKIEEVLVKFETEQVERHNRADPMEEVFQKIAYTHAEIDDNLTRLISHGQTFYRGAAEATR